MSDELTLAKCCSFQEGYVNPSQKIPSYFGGDIKWLRASDLNEGYVYDTERRISEKGFKSAGQSAKMFPKNSIAISKSGTIGSLGILKDEMCGNRAVINIVVNPNKADLKYIFYTLKYKKDEIVSRTGGSIQKNLYVSALETLTLNHNSIKKQSEISSVLSALDEKIELNNQINTELEAMAKTLYDYWFVQFDFPDADGKPYKSSGGQMIYNNVLKREIPEGWDNGVIQDLIDKVPSSNKVPAKNFKDTGKYPVIDQSQNFICGFIDDESTVIKPDIDTAHIIFGDHTRVVKLVNFNYARGADGTQVLIAKSDKVPSYLLYQIVLDIDLSNYGYARHYKFLKDTKCVIPSKLISQRFHEKVKLFHEKVRDNIFQNQELEKLRDWLLPMLMNGQVTVSQ